MITRLLAGVFLLFIILVGGVVALPFIVPMEVVATKVKEQVKVVTGREIDFSSIKISYWPNLGVDLNDVTFSNAKWAREEHMFKLSKLEAALALKPLLERRVEIKKFTFIEPVINLEIDTKGKPNWLFETEGAAKVEEKVSPESKSEAGVNAADIANELEFKFSKLLVKGGFLKFIDHKSGNVEKLSDIDVEIFVPDLKGSLDIAGDLVFRDKKTALKLFVKEPLSFIEGRVSPGDLEVKTEDVAFKAAGNMAIKGELLNGNVDVKISSLSDLIAWLSKEDAGKLPFTSVVFNSVLRANKTDIVLKDASLELDEIKAKGNVSVGYEGKPDIFARLSLGKLNLDRFVDFVNESGGSASKSTARSKKSSAKWDDTPIDLSVANKVNLDLQINTQGFSLKGINVGPSKLVTALDDGQFKFKSSKAKLFGGTFDSDLAVNAAKHTPSMNFSFNVDGVEAKPILKTFAGFDKLSGAASGKVSVNSYGRSQKTIISNLGGKGSIVFKDGSFEGVDLVKIAKLIQNRMTDMGVGEGKTDFVSLGGDFTISKGIARNNNLKMKGPLLQASGKGMVDLPKKYLNYRVTPVLTTSSNVEGAGGISVPVDIKGGFDNIKVKPDFASVINEIATDPAKAQKTIKDVKSTLETQVKELQKDPAKAIQNIFGGGGLFGGVFAPPPQEQPAQ